MSTFQVFIQQNPYIFTVLALWELVWKGFALWKAARKSQKYWYVALLVINSVGLLPIAYLLIDKYYKKADQS